MTTAFPSLLQLNQQDPNLTFRTDSELGIVRHLRGQLAKLGRRSTTSSIKSAVARFIKKHPDLFGKLDTKLETVHEVDDSNGGTTVVLQQRHGRHLVEGGTLRAHVNASGQLDTLANGLFPDLRKVAKRPRLSATQAAKKAFKAAKSEGELREEPELIVTRADGEARLAYRLRWLGKSRAGDKDRATWLAGEHGHSPQWEALVDAIDGKVLRLFDRLCTATVVGLGTGYYSGTGAVNAWDDGLAFQLRDTTRVAASGPELITDDEDGSSPSTDADNDWNDVSTTPRHDNQGAEVDCHRYVGDSIDYFSTVHGRNSYDDAGTQVTVRAHYGTNTDNAFWSPADQQLWIGDGTGAAPGFDYLCTDDILAHELTHAVTEYTCGLIYWSESGALNEAFSDIMAAFITGDWLIGEGCWLNAGAPALRNMADPTNGGLWDLTDPIGSVIAGHQPHHYSTRYTGFSDNAGVHINSGIINHLFYLLVVGGTHSLSGVTVAAIGQAQAEAILYQCMSVNLVGQPGATFLDFRAALLDACLDLFPDDFNLLTQVKRAFNAVGVVPDLHVRDNLADDGTEPYQGNTLWASPDIINRTSPSADPANDFADLTDDTLWENVEFGQDNFVYVRVNNRGPEQGDASINVYFSPATSFGIPTDWIHVGTLAETGIAPGETRISGPLTFDQALIPAVGHYCMIAVVSDALDPVPDLSVINSSSSYVEFVRNLNNVAYRNMNVVDVVPAAPGSLKVQVAAFPKAAERHDLRLHVDRFIPGARVRLRAPAEALAGARLRGLALVKRGKRENIYELLDARARRKQLAFQRQLDDGTVGFDELLLRRSFELEVEYVVPDEQQLQRLGRRALAAGFELRVEQRHEGEPVGAAGVRLRIDDQAGRRNEERPRPRRRRG
ncbi:MAG: M4 family metallopeptidase [Acidobacteriota bacterium]